MPNEYKSVTEHEAAAKPPAYHKLVQIAPDGGEVRKFAREKEKYVNIELADVVYCSHAADIVGIP